MNSLVAEWLPQMPDVLARLQDTAHPARVADLACGTGWAAIELAKAFPHITVDGRDNDEASIAIGRANAVDQRCRPGHPGGRRPRRSHRPKSSRSGARFPTAGRRPAK